MVLKYIKAQNLIGLFICFLLMAVIYSCKDNESEKIKTSKPEEIKNKDTVANINKNKVTDVSDTIKVNPNYDTYVNSRFGYSVKYPNILKKGSESENGDGCEFISEDGFIMKVYGSNDVSVFNKTLDEMYTDELKEHKDITYKVKKKNWFVISGYDGEMIFYIKKYIGTSSSNTLYLNYPSNLRDKYYDVITVISKSFKEGNID